MKLFAPKYYNKFKCIADKCAHSCCVGWEIDIDNTTLSKYNSLSCEYGTIIKESIENSDSAHFQLASHDRCPHLDSNGLCKIIKNIGEEYLDNIDGSFFSLPVVFYHKKCRLTAAFCLAEPRRWSLRQSSGSRPTGERLLFILYFVTIFYPTLSFCRHRAPCIPTDPSDLSDSTRQ